MGDTYMLGDIELGGLTPEQKKTLDILAKGGTLRDAQGLTADDVETVYTIGHTLYTQGKYDDAEPLFAFACRYTTTEPRYWMALGCCRQMMKSYQDAIDAYGFGYMLNAEDPWPAINAAVCYLALSDKDQAKDALSLAERSIALGKADGSARQRVAALRQAL